MNCVRMLITSLSLVVAKEELEEEAIVSLLDGCIEWRVVKELSQMNSRH